MLKCLHKIGWTLGIGVEGSPVAVLPPRGAKQVGSRPGLLPSVFLSEAFVAVWIKQQKNLNEAPWASNIGMEMWIHIEVPQSYSKR